MNDIISKIAAAVTFLCALFCFTIVTIALTDKEFAVAIITAMIGCAFSYFSYIDIKKFFFKKE